MSNDMLKAAKPNAGVCGHMHPLRPQAPNIHGRTSFLYVRERARHSETPYALACKSAFG